MTQELLQESREKPAYTEWLASLKQKVESTTQEEEEERRWKLRYGKA